MWGCEGGGDGVMWGCEGGGDGVMWGCEGWRVPLTLNSKKKASAQGMTNAMNRMTRMEMS